MSEMIVAIEDRSFIPVLDQSTPVRGVLECESTFSPDDVEPWLPEKLRTGEDFGPAIADARNGSVRRQIQTSQAVDVIRGGEKSNALPEEVQATVNYRLAPHENIDQLLETLPVRILIGIALPQF